jgi:hypothetical protein
VTTTEDRFAPCAFSRAILAGQAGCALARRRAEAEVEAIACTSPVANLNCTTLLALFRERARFALRLPAPSLPVSHAQSMRLQCGGVRALAGAMSRDEAPDIHALVAQARERWGQLAALPFDEIVGRIAAWEPRRRARGPGAGP